MYMIKPTGDAYYFHESSDMISMSIRTRNEMQRWHSVEVLLLAKNANI
jgi:hypothetical protein